MSLENSVVARFSKGGEHFEILVDPDGVDAVKNGEKDVSEILEADIVFKDARKGDKSSSESLQKVFSSEEVNTVAKEIILHGEIQLTTEQRREMQEKKQQRLINQIAMNAIDPRTQKPHPPERIKNALEQLNFKVDIHQDFNKQMEDAVHKMKPLLPIKIETLKIVIRVPSQYAPKAYTHLHKFEIQKEEWQKDGSLVAVVKIPGGMQDQLYTELNGFTHGDVETKILKE